MSTRIS